ncbi:hypothetical protein [Lachnospira pectinoschiza]|uniref:Uncharacterized protein n=1 Tax=Lachnospira pectinoschiza TaxID=28052 RepID=A0A1G9ZSA5_9FIRM|nr:hypothetical protein [Lachnospira pectinoschiza]SDN24005.1 hypothetical protein SAMN05216544_2229 [Lachnospira pectinoschiza]
MRKYLSRVFDLIYLSLLVFMFIGYKKHIILSHRTVGLLMLLLVFVVVARICLDKEKEIKKKVIESIAYVLFAVIVFALAIWLF